MTRQHALKRAQTIFGQRAAVQIQPRGARIGAHGEFIELHRGNNRSGDPKCGKYLCSQCSSMTMDDGYNLIEQRVWHPLGGFQASYRIGFIDSIIGGFNIRAEGATFEDAFEKVATK